MAPPESATVTDLAAARLRKTRGAVADDSRAGEEETRVGARKAPAPRRASNRRFDAEKVDRLKRAIAEGRYEIDPESVADRFIEHERNN